MKWLVHTLFVLMVLTGPLFGNEDLKHLRQKVRRVNAQLDSLKKVEGSYIAQIDALDRKIALLHQVIDRLDSKISRLQKRISVLSDSAAVARKKWKLHKRELLKLLREMYIMGGVEEWEIVLLAGDVNQLAENLVYLESISEARSATMNEAFSAYETYSGTVKRLKASRDSLKTILVQKRADADSLARARRKFKKMLARVRRDKAKRKKMLAQLQESIKKLESFLASRATGGGKFAALKGRLPCPLGKKCSVFRGFGKVRDKNFGTLINNPGVDFKAKRGQSVYAVAAGKVAEVVWLPGYQYVVIISHDGGYYTVYGNLGDVFVKRGDEVSAGEKIGAVGESSWLSETPQLHFEIRRGKAKENPLAWIK